MNKIKNSDYHFEYQEEPIQKDEQVLFAGINDEAVLKKKMDRITSFGIYRFHKGDYPFGLCSN
jgi:hypothetical protein